MNKPWRLHRAAERELDEAADHYDDEREGLGREFLQEVQATIEQLARTPRMGAPASEAPSNLAVRRFRVRRFPYWVVYLELHHEYRVLAVAHQRRHSSYWRERIEGALTICYGPRALPHTVRAGAPFRLEPPNATAS